MVNMKPVASRNLQAVGYDRKTRKLYARFHGCDKTYVYQNVPPLFWKALQLADSKGSFFQEWIVGNFKYEVVDEVAPPAL